MPNIRKRTTARPKSRPKPWVPTVVASQMPFAKASWPERRRRYLGFLQIVFKAGRTGRIEISEYEDAFLQSFAKNLDVPSTAGRIGKPGLVSPEERSTLREIHKRLTLLGVKLPDVGFR